MRLLNGENMLAQPFILLAGSRYAVSMREANSVIVALDLGVLLPFCALDVFKPNVALFGP